MNVLDLPALLPGIVLHFVRAGAFFVALPMFGTQSDSRMLRLILAITLATMFWWTGAKEVTLHGGLLQLGVLAAQESLIGFAAGYAVSLLTAAVATGGELISHEMGFTMAQVVNPETGKQSAVFAELLEACAYLLIFALDLHHAALHVLGAAYEALPVGHAFDAAAVYERLREMVAATLQYGVRYALPVLGTMLLLTAGFVILARAVPNINLMEFSFAARILLALLGAIWFLAEGTPFLRAMFDTMLHGAGQLFART